MEVLKSGRPENIVSGPRTMCICPLCLSKDRNFIILDDKLMNLTAALDIFSRETANRAVCWECFAILQKIARFKGTALQALQILQKRKPMVILNTNLSRLKKVTQTGVISVTANDMDIEMEEDMSPPYLPSSSSSLPSSSSSLPSSSPLSSPSSLPPLPPLQPSPHISIKLKQGDVPKLAKTAPKPIYIFVEKPKSVEKTAPFNQLRPVISKRIKKYSQKEAAKAVEDEKVLNVFQVTDRAPKTHKLGKIMTSDDYYKAKMSPTIEARSQEIVISDSEFDAISDNDTPLYLNYEDSSDNEYEELHYDSDNDVAHDEPTHCFDAPETIKSTNNQVIEEHNGNEKSVVNNFNNINSKRSCKSIILNILDNDTVQKVQKRIIKKQNNNIITTYKVFSIANNKTSDKLLKKQNSIVIEDTEKQKRDNKITIHDLPYCSVENVEKQDTNVKILTNIKLKTTINNLDKPNNSELVQEHLIQDAILQKASSELCVNEQNISVVKTEDVLSDANHMNRDVANCDDVTINVDISNSDYNYTVTDIQRCVGKNTDCEVLIHHENNTDTPKLPQIPIDNDKMSPDQEYFSENDTHIESIDNDTITEESPQKYSENGKNTECEVLINNENNTDTPKPPHIPIDNDKMIPDQEYFSESDTHIESIDNETITKETPQQYSENGKNTECEVLTNNENNTDTHNLPQIPIINDTMSLNQKYVSENDTHIESIVNDTITKETPQQYSENRKNTECEVVLHNENNTETRKFLQKRLINDKMRPVQSFFSENDALIDSIDRDTMTNEKPLKHSENACQALIEELKSKPQLIVNKITDDKLWNKVNNKESNKIIKSPKAMKPRFKNARSPKKNYEFKQKINLDTLLSSVIVLRDHCYSKHTVSKLNQLRRKIQNEIKIKTSDCPKEETIKRITSPSLTSISNTAINDTEIIDLYANEVLNDDCLRATDTDYNENEHLNVITTNNMADECRSFSPYDIAISNVNMSVSIDMREFFPELPVCDADMLSNDIKTEYDTAELNENADYSVSQCGMEQEEMHIKLEPIDSNYELTDSASDKDYYFENNEQNFNNTYNVPAAPSFDDHYHESLVSNGYSSNLIHEIHQKETEQEKNSLKEKEMDFKINSIARKLFQHLTDNTFRSNSNIEYREEQENITSGLKSKYSSEEVMTTGGVKDSSEHLKNTDDYLLEPICYTDWIDETYSHVTIDNKNKSYQSGNAELSIKVKNNNYRKRARRANNKEKRKRKAPEQKINAETQNKYDSNNEDNGKSSFFPKRNKRNNNDMKKAIMHKKMNDKLLLPAVVESETNYKPIKKRMKKDKNYTKQAIIQERINEDKLSLHPVVESETNHNPNEKIIKKDSNNIKETIMQEKINPKLLPHPIIGSEENNNSNQPNSENDGNQSNADKIAPIDFIEKNHEITLNEIDDLSGDNIALEKLSTDSKEIEELSNDTNVVIGKQCNIIDKTVKLLSKKINDSQEIKEQIHVPGETNSGKLLLYPVIALEKNVILDRYCKTKSKGKKLNEIEINQETNESHAYKITPTDFIENNKEITLDELEGEFSDDELVFGTDDTRTDDPPADMDIDDEEINKHANKKNEQNVTRTEDNVDKELEILREKLKKDSVFEFSHHNCLVCMQVFSTKLGLNNHMRKHETSGKFTCGICNHELRTSVGLKNHTHLKHRRTRSSTYHCKRFDKTSVLSPNQLATPRERLVNNLTSAENNLCTTENNSTSTDNNLCSTENSSTSTENNLCTTENNSTSTGNNLCTTENNSTSTENNLCSIENNVSFVESEPSPVEEIKSTESNTRFTENEKSSRNTCLEKKYCCFICNKQYDCYDLLFEHQTFKHNGGIKLTSNYKNDGRLNCFVCRKQYVRFAFLFWHQIVKHEALKCNRSTNIKQQQPANKYPNKYLCFKCSDRFASFSELLIHQIECHSDGTNIKNNLSSTENNFTLTENNSNTTGNIVTSTENNLSATKNKSSSGNMSTSTYKHICFLCNNRYKRFDSLLLHQKHKH